MEITLKRTWVNPLSTIGDFKVYHDGDLNNSIFKCYSLEDIERPVKVFGKTCIPKGRYEIAFTWSEKFKRDVLMLLNVPNFDRIYCHEGVKAEDTNGCILLAMIRRETVIEKSKPAVEAVEKLAREAKKRGEKIFITIS